ncbi:MAG: polyprenyl synthetase family protein [Desulfovibrio sp.]|jgi:geranylgeranyl diphosphate synthase type II|nr:polyprenyl synthetase family protein [Desulfovibrio sp.]
MDDNSKELLGWIQNQVEAYLEACFVHEGIPRRLASAMRYSLLAGGKRIRPVLCLASASLCGLEETEDILPFAAGIEMIHTYSLIHDDLPAMDDDDLRRGKPSCHKRFDEATAILAGDGLLTEAFVHMAACHRCPPEVLLRAMREVAVAAGCLGMVGGQQLDMDHTGRVDMTLPDLQHMHALKTGALIRAACVSGARLACADTDRIASIAAYGEALGVAFQIADDILDVVADSAELGKTAGNDEKAGKNTYPTVLGLAESRDILRERSEAARKALEDLPDVPERTLLTDMVGRIAQRALEVRK